MGTHDLATLQRALSEQLTSELSELHRLQAQNDRKRAEADSKKKQNQEKLLQNILEGQAAELEEKAKTRKLISKYVGWSLIAVFGGGGSTLGYTQFVTPSTPVSRVTTTISDDVEKRLRSLERRLDRGDRVDARIIEIQMDQQVELTESVQFLGDKIDKVNSRARSVPTPKSVETGKTKAAAIMRVRGDLPRYDPANPLADIPVMD